MKLKILLIITAVTTPIMVVIMMLQGAPLKSISTTPLGILDLEFAGTVQRATDIYNAWQPSIVPVAINSTLIDFLFLISYGCFLYASSLMVSRLYENELWKKFGRWSGTFALTASLFDIVENLLMLRTLNGNIYKEIVSTTLIFAVAKFALVVIAVLYILISLGGLLFRRKTASNNSMVVNKGF